MGGECEKRARAFVRRKRRYRHTNERTNEERFGYQRENDILIPMHTSTARGLARCCCCCCCCCCSRLFSHRAFANSSSVCVRGGTEDDDFDVVAFQGVVVLRPMCDSCFGQRVVKKRSSIESRWTTRPGAMRDDIYIYMCVCVCMCIVQLNNAENTRDLICDGKNHLAFCWGKKGPDKKELCILLNAPRRESLVVVVVVERSRTKERQFLREREREKHTHKKKK